MTDETREFLEAVVAFHEPNVPPSTCMWCGRRSPCPPYTQASEALASAEARS